MMKRVSNISAAGYCQLGRRSNQEDALWPVAPSNADRLFLVCDGVGGCEGGELASQCVCRLLPQQMKQCVDNGLDVSNKWLCRVAHRVQQQLTRENIGEAATTMTMLYLHDRGATVAHVGDSRVYLFRKGVGLMFRTHDHSLVQQYIDSGMITEAEARNHPEGNIITMAMRPIEEGEPEGVPAIDRITDVRPGDLFLLCTDGVWGKLTDAELWDILGADMPLEQRVQNLATATADSHDNNTAMVVEVIEVADPPARSWIGRMMDVIRNGLGG